MGELELDVFNDDVAEAIMDTIDYPCIVVEGVSSEYELEFLSKLKSGNATFPLYCKVESVVRKIGVINMDIQTFLLLKSIDNYSVKLFGSKDSFSEIKLDDYHTFLKMLGMKESRG